MFALKSLINEMNHVKSASHFQFRRRNSRREQLPGKIESKLENALPKLTFNLLHKAYVKILEQKKIHEKSVLWWLSISYFVLFYSFSPVRLYFFFFFSLFFLLMLFRLPIFSLFSLSRPLYFLGLLSSFFLSVCMCAVE